MPVDRALWRHPPFKPSEYVRRIWRCPSCESGSLHLKAETLHCTRLQGEWRSVASFAVEPGAIGLTALEEAGDGIDQGAKGRLAQLAAGLTQ